MKKLVFMGPPGAGKGTQAKKICLEYSIPQISTGEILREAIQNKTELGLNAKKYMDSGDLVPDSIVIGIIKDRLKQGDCKHGFLLDGFPRTTAQAEELNRILTELGYKLDATINISVPDAELVRRLLERAKVEGRSDDNEETIKNRLKNYNEKTFPLLSFYKSHGLLKEVDGMGSVEDITFKIKKELG